MTKPLDTRIPRRTLLKTAPVAGLATLMRPEGSLGADAVRFAFFADPSEALAYAQLIDEFEASQDTFKIEPIVISSSNVAPLGRLLPASDGRLYGTTTEGGSSDQGTVFSISPR